MKSVVKKVKTHLKEDMKTFRKEIGDDKKLLKTLKPMKRKAK